MKKLLLILSLFSLLSAKGAVQFSGTGTNNGIYVPDNSAFETLTYLQVIAWVYVDGATSANEQYLVADGTFVAFFQGWALETIGKTNLQMIWGNSTGYGVTSTASNVLPINAWCHIAVSVDGNQSDANKIKFWINGVSQATFTSTFGTGYPTTTSDNSVPMIIGTYSDLIAVPLRGRIEEVVIMKQTRHLSDNQVLLHYTSRRRFMFQTPDLIAYYPLNIYPEGQTYQGKVVPDLGPNGLTAFGSVSTNASTVISVAGSGLSYP